MARLIVDQPAGRMQAILRNRVLIGRWGGNGICLNYVQVSRIHAWIDRRPDGKFQITDAASRTGTLLNGKPIREPSILKAGDRITIGPATCKVLADTAPGDGAKLIDIADDGTCPTSNEKGILFTCKCGSPVWTPYEAAGKQGTCHLCGQALTVPSARGATHARWRRSDSAVESAPPPAAPRPARPVRPAAPAAEIDATSMLDPSAATSTTVEKSICSVCQTAIEANETTWRCPSCGQQFHTECWQENRGCSMYGCPGVNSLGEKVASLPVPMPVPIDDSNLAPPAPIPAVSLEGLTVEGQQVPWPYLLLIGSAIGGMVGLPAFGIPAALVGILSTIYGLRAKPDRQQRMIVILAIIACMAGVVGGIIFSSRFWWPHSTAWTGGSR